MNEALAAPHAARAVQQLLDQLVRIRQGKRPDDGEAAVRRAVWEELRSHAGLQDPNQLTSDAVEAAAWVLIALLAVELRDRWDDE